MAPTRRSGSEARDGGRGLLAARRGALVLAAAALGLTAFHADGEEARSLYRIGVVTNGWAATHPTVLGLKAGLRELGLEEGRDVSFDVRFTQGRPEAAPAVARALVDGGANLLFTVGVAGTLAAKSATDRLPVVFAQVSDPVAAGAVPALVRPGGNVTGVSSIASELAPKRLEILKALHPEMRRVWLVHPRDDATAKAAILGAREASALLGVTIVPRAVSGADDLDRIRSELRVGDALLASDEEVLDLPAGLLKLSLAARVPTVFPSSFWVGYGGLISYGPDYFAQGTQAARLVAKILRGAQPAELPVEGADVLDLAVNLRTAGALDISVPRTILLRANTIRR